MPIASGPRSPAKSGSHSAIVEPISAPTCRFAASIARRKATPSGMCEARMIDVGPGVAELGHDARPVRDGQVVCRTGNDRRPRARSRDGRRVGDRMGVVVVRGDDRDPKLSGRLGEPRRELGRGERRRVRAEVRAARADPEDERQAAAGQPVGHRARLPVHEAGVAGRLAGGDRQLRRIGTDDDGRAVGLEGGHDRRRVGARLEVADVEDDPPAADAAVGVDEVGRGLDARELLLRESRGVAVERKDGADADLRRRRGGATPTVAWPARRRPRRRRAATDGQRLGARRTERPDMTPP